MKIRLLDGLPFVAVTLEHGGQQVEMNDVLLDTGSATTVLSTDRAFAVGLQYEPEDVVHRIRGVGGSEFVFSKQVDRLSIGGLQQNHCLIEIGALEYGFQLDGIVGIDFLVKAGAVIDLHDMEIRK